MLGQSDVQVKKEPVDGRGSTPDRGRAGKKPLRRQQQLLLELQSELERKTRQLAIAESEQANLQRRLKVLELVVPLRDQQLAALSVNRDSGAKQQQQRCSVSDPVSHPLAPAAGPSHSSASSACVRSTNASVDSAHGALGDGTVSSAADFDLDFDHLVLAPSSPAVHATTPAPAGPSPAPSGAPRTPPEVIQSFIKLWNKWVRDAGLFLHAHDARPHDPTAQSKVDSLHNVFMSEYSRLRTEHPTMIVDLLSVNFDTGLRCEGAPEDHWLPAVRALQLTPEQVADSRAALSLYRERMEVILRERRGIEQQLCSCLSALAGEEVDGTGQLRRMKLILEAEELQQQLDRNVKAEGHCQALARDFNVCGLYSHLQLARVSVLSYPYYPDAVALLHAIAAVYPEAPVPAMAPST